MYHVCRRVANLLIVAVVLCMLPREVLTMQLQPGISHCQEGHPLSPQGDDAMLARGFNLPNWDPEYPGLKPDDGLLSQLKEQGFSHIRLPVDGEKLMSHFASDDRIADFLQHLDNIVHRLHSLGYAVSVDMHPGGGFQRIHANRPETGLSMLIEAWNRIATQAQTWPRDRIYFELLNEPVPPQHVWWQQAQELVTFMNRIAKGRRLIVGPAVFQRYEPLLDAAPLEGDGLVYAIHYYDPFVFTHQAMTWDDASYLSRIGGLPFPADLNNPALQKQLADLGKKGERQAAADIREAYAEKWDAHRILAVLAQVGSWARRNDAVVIVNEFGVLNFNVDQGARTEWLRAVRKAAEASCLGWAHWDFSDGFAMVDPATTLPDARILDALMGKERD